LKDAPEPEPAPFLALPPGGVPPDLVWWLRAADGVRLRAGLWRAAARHGQGGREPGRQQRDERAGRAQVVLLPGRTEYLEQQALPAAELVRRGLDVVSLDWRGQGLADRLSAASPLRGHVADFADFHADLEALLADDLVALPAERGARPRIVLGNSMGGTIALAALGQGVLGPVQAAILTAPMFEIAMGRPTRWTARTIIAAAGLLGFAEHWPPWLQGHVPFVLRPFKDNLLTRDEAYWDWMAGVAREHPALSVGLPTFGWLAAAGRAMDELRLAPPPPCPVLCVVGTEERVVELAAIREGGARIGARLAEVAGARHLLLAEAEPMRGAAWAAIDAFLDDVLSEATRAGSA
jgi:lysophospholipase